MLHILQSIFEDSFKGNPERVKTQETCMLQVVSKYNRERVKVSLEWRKVERVFLRSVFHCPEGQQHSLNTGAQQNLHSSFQGFSSFSSWEAKFFMGSNEDTSKPFKWIPSKHLVFRQHLQTAIYNLNSLHTAGKQLQRPEHNLQQSPKLRQQHLAYIPPREHPASDILSAHMKRQWSSPTVAPNGPDCTDTELSNYFTTFFLSDDLP